MTTKTNYKDFSVGSDAEFVMTDRVTKRGVKITDYVDKNANFGADENSSGLVGEIRSGVSKNPLEVAKSIQNIMQEALNDIPEINAFDWNGGSFIKSVPVSFHFHAGHEKNLLNIDDAVKYLDDYLLSISLLLEDTKQGLKRRAYNKTPAQNEVSYGKLSAYRIVKHNLLDRWEYRPVSSTLVSKEICTAFLCLFKIVLFEHINNPNLRYKGYIDAKDVIKMNTSKIYSLFPSIWAEIQNMILYKKYAKHLQIIPQLVKEKACWTPKNIDIKKAWGLSLDVNTKPKPSFKQIWDDYQVVNKEVQAANKIVNKVVENKMNNKAAIIKNEGFVPYNDGIPVNADGNETPLIYNPYAIKYGATKIPKINNNKKMKVVKKITKAKKKVNPVINKWNYDFSDNNAPIYVNEDNENSF